MIARVAAPRSLLSGLTYARIVAVPVVMALILAGPGRSSAYTAAAIVFAVAAMTDFVDGYLARRWEVSTKLGSFLDTTADKLLVTGALIALVDVDRASPWIAAIIISRELLILGLRGVVAAEGTVFPPSIWGKLKTNAQFIAIFLAILRLGGAAGYRRLVPLFLGIVLGHYFAAGIIWGALSLISPEAARQYVVHFS